MSEEAGGEGTDGEFAALSEDSEDTGSVYSTDLLEDEVAATQSMGGVDGDSDVDESEEAVLVPQPVL